LTTTCWLKIGVLYECICELIDGSRVELVDSGRIVCASNNLGYRCAPIPPYLHRRNDQVFVRKVSPIPGPPSRTEHGREAAVGSKKDLDARFVRLQTELRLFKSD
jgi:hypothetical protein